ncbi:MAG: hypothetical protein IRZ08_20905 [Frankia sp.]|nr:hypothetical protein [Frankia sp.]
MTQHEATTPAGSWTPPGQRMAGGEQTATTEQPAEQDVISVGPLANPNRLRLGVPAAV